MRWNEFGQVGIGTTSLQGSGGTTRLTLQGNDTNAPPMQLTVRGDTDNNKRLLIGYNTTTNYGAIQAYSGASTTTTLLLNQAGGSVGIGVSSATMALEVNGAIAAAGFAVLIATGVYKARDIKVPGIGADGVVPALDYLIASNRKGFGDEVPDFDSGALNAHGKNVVVIGGGDTAMDCVRTAIRQGAASVTQFELMPMPPEEENKPLVWPYWPTKLRTSSSHEEGCERDWAVATKRLEGKGGK
eukprot:gene8980-11040_t